jgi:hypothetical protein
MPESAPNGVAASNIAAGRGDERAAAAATCRKVPPQGVGLATAQHANACQERGESKQVGG